MDIYDIKELEKLLEEYLYSECLHCPSLSYLQKGGPQFTNEHLQYADNLTNKTKATIECLKVVRETIRFFNEDED